MEEGRFLVGRLVVVGLGLVGGSIALAAKRKGLARCVVGVVRREEAIEEAVGRGAVHEATLDLEGAVEGANMVVLCTPVRTIISQLPVVASSAPEGCLITDVGSTKREVMRAAEEALAGRKCSFVGGHPMAGGEKRGLSSARADLFEGAPYALIPGPNLDEEGRSLMEGFVRGLGALPVWIEDPDEHDRVVAVTSHLPHAVACALVLAFSQAMGGEIPRLLGRGFLDTTRVASSPAGVWADIFETNTSHLLPLLRLLRAKMAEIERALATGDRGALERLLEEAREAREKALKGAEWGWGEGS